MAIKVSRMSLGEASIWFDRGETILRVRAYTQLYTAGKKTMIAIVLTYYYHERDTEAAIELQQIQEYEKGNMCIITIFHPRGKD